MEIIKLKAKENGCVSFYALADKQHNAFEEEFIEKRMTSKEGIEEFNNLKEKNKLISFLCPVDEEVQEVVDFLEKNVEAKYISFS